MPEAAATVEIRAAGELVLREFQLDLEHLPSPVDPQLARSIMRERLWAVSALIRLGRSWAVGAGTGHKYAKEIQLEVTGGTPLTICIGDVCKIVVDAPVGRHDRRHKKTASSDLWGDVGFTVEGCGVVMPDVARTTGGFMWKAFCDDCSNETRKPHGDQRKDVEETLAQASMREDWSVYSSTFHISVD